MLPSKFKKGDHLYATQVNEIISRLRAIDSTPTGAGGMKGFRESALAVVAVDESGASYPAFSALAIESLSGDDPFNQSGRRAVKVRVPQEGDEGRICILGTEMTAGISPIAYFSGLCPVLLTRTASDTGLSADGYCYAELKTGATALEAAGAGSAEIVWEDESGTLTEAHLAFVRFPLGGVGGTCDSPRDASYGTTASPTEHVEEARDDLAYKNAASEDVLWDRGTQSIAAEEEGGEATEFDGLKITQSLGTAYYDAGDQIIYQYVADFYYDSKGCLVKVSKERRVTIDVPVDYTDSSEV